MPTPHRRPRARLVLALAALPFALTACGTVPTTAPDGAAPSSADPSGPADSTGPDQSGPSDGACQYTQTGEAARPVQPPGSSDISSSGTVSYLMKLNGRDVTLALNRAKAPCTVHSFESLVAQKYFDGTRCHRLVDSGIFVLQCGDPTGTGSGGPGYSFPDETDGTETYPKGTVAMANAGPNTNGSQFFLVWNDSPLPPDYTVFGTYTDKTDAVAAVASQGQDGSSGSSGGGTPNSPADISTITKAG